MFILPWAIKMRSPRIPLLGPLFTFLSCIPIQEAPTHHEPFGITLCLTRWTPSGGRISEPLRVPLHPCGGNGHSQESKVEECSPGDLSSGWAGLGTGGGSGSPPRSLGSGGAGAGVLLRNPEMERGPHPGGFPGPVSQVWLPYPTQGGYCRAVRNVRTLQPVPPRFDPQPAPHRLIMSLFPFRRRSFPRVVKR